MKLIIEISEGIYKHIDTIQNGSIGAKQILNAVKDGIPAYKAIPSAEPKWIPCEERLPENSNQEVLISLEWGIDIGRYSDGEWHSEWINHYDDGNVLAWMPLPKPFEPQERSE